MRELILVDGYNLLHANEELRRLSDISLEEARLKLEKLIAGYSIYIKKKIVLVYDGHMVKDNRGEVIEKDGITIVFTKENVTADTYIEQATYDCSDRYMITVVTNDLAESSLAFFEGAVRLGSRAFMAMIIDSFELEKKMHRRRSAVKSAGVIADDFKIELMKWKEREIQS